MNKRTKKTVTTLRILAATLTCLWVTYSYGSGSFVPDPATHNAATRAVYNQLSSLPGVMLGLGRLGPFAEPTSAGGIKVGNKPAHYPANLAWWKAEYGDHLPSAMGFELTVQWGEKWLSRSANRKRAFARIEAFAKKGGLPLVRDHAKRLDLPSNTKHASAYDRGSGHVLRRLLPTGQDHDRFVAYYTHLAKRFKALGYPVVFRPFHEMNGRWFWWGGQPKAFKKLWREVHAIFAAQGVRNVLWCWTVSGRGNPGESIKDYYPGDQYVDLFAIDYYAATPTFSSLLRRRLNTLVQMAHGRPIFFGDFGIVASSYLYTHALPSLFQAYPDIKGVMLWWGTGWRPWRLMGPYAGSAIDNRTPARVRNAFSQFLARPDIIDLNRWRSLMAGN